MKHLHTSRDHPCDHAVRDGETVLRSVCVSESTVVRCHRRLIEAFHLLTLNSKIFQRLGSFAQYVMLILFTREHLVQVSLLSWLVHLKWFIPNQAQSLVLFLLLG